MLHERWHILYSWRQATGNVLCRIASLWEFQLFSYSKSFFLPCLCNSHAFMYLLNKPIYFSPADIDLIFNFQSWSQKQQNVQQIIFCIMIVYQIEFSMTGMDICGYERIKKPKWCGYSCFLVAICVYHMNIHIMQCTFLGGVKKMFWPSHVRRIPYYLFNGLKVSISSLYNGYGCNINKWYHVLSHVSMAYGIMEE